MDFRAEIRRNRLRLRIALGVYFALALGAGYLTGRAFLFIAEPEAYYRVGEAAGREGATAGSLATFGYVQQVTIAVLLLAWANYRRMARRGDRIVLSLAGARPLGEWQLRNTGEEMAIAAGMPAPRFWVVESPELNAFACDSAGGTASVVLTRGLLERLPRDELQAVVGHEIAHIGNGDARLMTVLLGLGWTFHLVSVFVLGPLRLVFDAAMYGSDDESEPGARGEESASSERRAPFWERSATPKGIAIAVVVVPVLVLLLMAVGLALSLGLMMVFGLILRWFPWLVAGYVSLQLLREWQPRVDEWLVRCFERYGWLAVLFVFVPGGLIVGPAIPVLGIVVPMMLLLLRLQVARNREFQADAVAVELNRDPGALRRALERIRDTAVSSQSAVPLPKTLSPLTIVSTRRGRVELPALRWITSIFSTHPPLDERIARLAEMEGLEGHLPVISP